MTTKTPETDAKWNLETNKGHFHDWRSVAFEMRDHARAIESRLSETSALLEARIEASNKLNAKLREQDACIGKQEREIGALKAQSKADCAPCRHEWYLGKCAHCGMTTDEWYDSHV